MHDEPCFGRPKPMSTPGTKAVRSSGPPGLGAPLWGARAQWPAATTTGQLMGKATESGLKAHSSRGRAELIEMTSNCSP